MDDNLLREVQLVQLEILKDVDRICRKHNIKYYLIGGTLLGAIRHKGFIPGDDDLDIAMFRKDYDKFIEIYSKEKNKSYFIQNHKTEKNYWMFITKIRKNNTIFEDNVSINTNSHSGVYIDIFPLDNIPEYDSVIQKMQYGIIRGLSAVSLYKNNYRSFNNKKIKFICQMLSVLPYKVINFVGDCIVKLYNNNETEYVTSWLSNYGYNKQRMHKYDIYGEGVEVEFEGAKFLAPNNFHLYLTKLFGNYMELPPEEERGNRHIRLNVKL